MYTAQASDRLEPRVDDRVSLGTWNYFIREVRSVAGCSSFEQRIM